MNINGSIREFFKCSDYIGVDWIDGADVDLVSLAHEVPFEPMTFDTVVSASMLEHDPYWKKSLSKMTEVMKSNGLFAISWGSILNIPHCDSSAPDGKFHPLRAGLVLNHMEKIGIYVHEFYYEETFLIKNNEEHRIRDIPTGTAALIAFKDRSLAIGKREISPLIPEDMA